MNAQEEVVITVIMCIAVVVVIDGELALAAAVHSIIALMTSNIERRADEKTSSSSFLWQWQTTLGVQLYISQDGWTMTECGTGKGIKRIPDQPRLTD